jgi:hypothetical protein
MHVDYRSASSGIMSHWPQANRCMERIAEDCLADRLQNAYSQFV